MKRLMILALAMSAVVAPGCQRSVPPVPGSRIVVGPRGTTDVTKPWNPITKQEGDAILGPLSNARR